jgi:Protein of unknown function (DUF2865)
MRSINIVVLMGALSGASVVSAIAQPPLPPAAHQPGNHTIQSVGLFDWLFGGSRKDAPSQPQSPEEGNSPRQSQEIGGTYRTLCVRLCDGFYFPISVATTRSRFADDASRCEQQCPSRSRLFVYRNAGESVEDMADLNGEPYTKLPEAFRFRASYVENCTCRGNPWDAESVARHAAYAPVSPPTASAPTTAGKPKLAEPRRRSRQSSWGYRGRED